MTDTRDIPARFRLGEKPVDLKFVCDLPYGAKVVDMVECNGRIYVATEECVYWLDGEELRPVGLQPAVP